MRSITINRNIFIEILCWYKSHARAKTNEEIKSTSKDASRQPIQNSACNESTDSGQTMIRALLFSFLSKVAH
jgi:hypothetical protein